VKTKRYFTTGYFDGCWKSCKARFLSAWLRPTVQRHRFCASSNSSFVLKFSGWGGSGSFICDSCWRKSTLLTAWRDGISHRVMAPMEFMQRLAALVPRPRLHLIRFHGVLAPNATLRKAVVPVPVPPTASAPAPMHAGDCAHLPVGSAKGRMRWAQLLKRVFDIDIERCPHCGGQLKLIAVIEDAAAIARLLTHLGLAAQPPPRALARRVDLFQAA
jgi:hypothetical protein